MDTTILACLTGCATHLHLDNHFIYLRLQLAQILYEEHAQDDSRSVQLLICTGTSRITLILPIHVQRGCKQ